jgi:CMP/dCMP kinase
MIITIDGPAGSGKSTAARELAGELKIAFLDTGATYRAATLKAMREGIDLADSDALAACAAGMKLEFLPRSAGLQVILDGADVSADIRSPQVTENSRYAAASPQVRGVLVELQRRIGRALGSFVSEGRDQGSVVFPDADVKFYLDATPQTRAHRRWLELTHAGVQVNEAELLAQIIERDRRDSSRATAPLTRPAGAVVIDTSDMTISQVTQSLLAHVRGKL